jgi:large subunit ribosomal protein L19
MNRVVDEFEKPFLKERVTQFRPGDQVDVHTRIVEGDKERIQVFSGVVIARKGRGIGETFTVRRIVQGEGVERTFPVHSPRVARIVIQRRGRVRRAKLYYLRDLTGKAARLREVRLSPDFEFDADAEPAKAAAKSKSKRRKKAKTKAEKEQ